MWHLHEYEVSHIVHDRALIECSICGKKKTGFRIDDKWQWIHGDFFGPLDKIYVVTHDYDAYKEAIALLYAKFGNEVPYIWLRNYETIRYDRPGSYRVFFYGRWWEEIDIVEQTGFTTVLNRLSE